MNSKSPFYFGMLGGALIVAIFLIVLFSLNLFNYRIHIDKIYVNALQGTDTIQETVGSAFNAQIEFKKQMVAELQKDKIVLTPQEYTNNVVNYYNNLLMFLSIMLAAFSILSFVYLRAQSNDLIQDKLQSEEFKEEVSEALVGMAESRFRDRLSEIQDELKSIRNEMAAIDEPDTDNELE
jgi:hypothetical protein